MAEYRVTALSLAAMSGCKASGQLIPEYGVDIDIDILDVDGWTAVRHAASSGYEALVRLLLDHGADVDV